MKTKYFKILFLTILCIAIGLRFFKLGEVPVSLYWDETAILLDAKTIASNGLDMHGNSWFRTMFPSYGDYKLPVYIWLAALSVKLLGVSEFALRLPSAVAGIGTVLVSGGILYQLVDQNKKTSVFKNMPTEWATVVGCLLMTITPWSIMFSRTGFEGHVGQFFVGLSMLLLLHSKNKKWLLIPSVLLGTLATYTYFSVRFVWPVIFIAGYVLFQSNVVKKIGFHIGILAFCVIAYVASLQPMFNSPLYAASNQFRLNTTSVLNSIDYPVQANILRAQAGNTIIDRIIFHRHWLLLRELAKNYADGFDFSFLFLTGDPNLRHGTGSHGVLLLPMLPLLLWGLYVLAKDKPKTLFFLSIWWLLGLLPASVPENTPHALRSLNALLPILLIVGFGGLDFLQTLHIKIKKHGSFQEKTHVSVLTLFAISIVVASMAFNYYYFAIYPNKSARNWQDGYQQLAEYILVNKDSVQTVWVTPFENRFYLWLLVYGPYTAAEIQSLESKEYNVTKIDNIFFEDFNWDRIKSVDHTVAVLGQESEIDNGFATLGRNPDDLHRIIGHDGQVRYVVATYEKLHEN